MFTAEKTGNTLRWHWKRSGQQISFATWKAQLFMLLELEEDIKWPEDKDAEDYLKQVIWEELL